ncbi:hypothetical protein LSH36_18g04028 [Paralvinella palmiformis]|uniref:Uncharacterized protein n=1 Tax=Paralvinella palmiformis TaxID=53620 RepID=A0AAD9NFN1_9ANNE|nr:hypothetical protein LSH36_18g04028 [Paralvinella palmiformis]
MSLARYSSMLIKLYVVYAGQWHHLLISVCTFSYTASMVMIRLAIGGSQLADVLPLFSFRVNHWLMLPYAIRVTCDHAT